jgi:hypothetical protein
MNAAQTIPSINGRFVVALLDEVWEQQAAKFKETASADNWNGLVEIMNARQMWLAARPEDKAEIADHLVYNVFISNWVDYLARKNVQRGEDAEEGFRIQARINDLNESDRQAARNAEAVRLARPSVAMNRRKTKG